MPDRMPQQQFFMRWAIQLGEKGRKTAPPNPWVGCVIVKEGEILGEGYHVAPGKPHAEIVALEKAGILAKGGTAFVSLEPCAHYGRTPPCIESLIKAGIKKVFIPLLDPDPHVAGKGVEALRSAGIDVNVGICKEEAEKSLEPYLFQRRNHRPYCVLKVASSLDGKVAAADGSSMWITGEEARANVQQLRAESQAIIIGSTTAMIDNPRLTVRLPDGPKPLRVLIDSKGKVPLESALFDQTLAKTLVFTTTSCPLEKLHDLHKKGVETFVEKEKVDLAKMLEELHKRGVIQVLVEGGPTLQSAFFQAHLVEKYVAYIGGCFLGEGKPTMPGLKLHTIDEAVRLKLEEVHRFGEDVRLDYKFFH